MMFGLSQLVLMGLYYVPGYHELFYPFTRIHQVHVTLIIMFILPIVLGIFFRWRFLWKYSEYGLARRIRNIILEPLILSVLNSLLSWFLLDSNVSITGVSAAYFYFLTGLCCYCIGIGWAIEFKVVGLFFLVATLGIVIYPEHVIYFLSPTMGLSQTCMGIILLRKWINQKKVKVSPDSRPLLQSNGEG